MSKCELPEIIQNALEEMVGLRTDRPKWCKLAEAIGTTEGTLRNKVSRASDDKRHHVSLAEALTIATSTNNQSLVHAICKHFNGQFLPFSTISVDTYEDILINYTAMMKELGQFSMDIHTSLLDGKISLNEIEGLRKDFLKLTGAISSMMDRLQEKADEDEIEMRKSPSLFRDGALESTIN
jgi:hypothetical protein